MVYIVTDLRLYGTVVTSNKLSKLRLFGDKVKFHDKQKQKMLDHHTLTFLRRFFYFLHRNTDKTRGLLFIVMCDDFYGKDGSSQILKLFYIKLSFLPFRSFHRDG